MTIGKVVVGGVMLTLATLMTIGLVKTTKEGFYKIKGSNKKYKSVKELEKELNKIGYIIK